MYRVIRDLHVSVESKGDSRGYISYMDVRRLNVERRLLKVHNDNEGLMGEEEEDFDCAGVDGDTSASHIDPSTCIPSSSEGVEHVNLLQEHLLSRKRRLIWDVVQEREKERERIFRDKDEAHLWYDSLSTRSMSCVGSLSISIHQQASHQLFFFFFFFSIIV